MFQLTIANIRAQRARFVLSAVAVILGVAFMAGTLVLTDTIRKSYDDLAAGLHEETDALVQSSVEVQTANGKPARGTLDAGLLERVRSLPSVEAADAQISGIAMIVGKDGELLDDSPNRPAPIAVAWQADDRLNPMDLVEGRAPSAADEVVIDRASAEEGGFAVGDPVRVVSKAGSEQYRIAGIATYAGQDDAAGAQVLAFEAGRASSVIGEPGRIDAIGVVARPGVSEARLAADLRAALAEPGTEVLTGDEAREQVREDNGASLEFLSGFLMVFAVASLVVGAFVIYNTFSITVAQRSRTTALLRAVGAKRRQVMRSIVVEAAATGLVGSAIGVAAGIGTAKGIAGAFAALDIELPATGTVVRASTVVASMVVGTIVTVVAAYLPARRAGKVPPIAALRDVAVERPLRTGRRTVIGTLLTGGGVALMASGLSGGEFGPVGLGALVVFAGVTVLGPVMARPFVRIVGAPLPVLRGFPGRIAGENAVRNPKRTAATAAALRTGVALVAFITVFAASTKASIGDSIDTSVRADWIVQTAWGMGGLSPEAAEALDALPETAGVTPLRFADVEVDGSALGLAAFDPKAGAIDLHAVEGDLSDLGPSEVAVWQELAEDEGLSPGDAVTVAFPDSGEQQLIVGAIYEEMGPTEGYAVTLEAFGRYVADQVDNFLAVDVAPGVPVEQARSAMETVLADYPNATVHTLDEFKGTVAAEIDQMLNLIYVLLSMALLISLFGIANTLALSVFERRREMGMLRAVGMSRRQLRRSVRWESVLITLLGTATGLGLGIGFGYAMVEVMSSQGISTFVVPVAQLASIVGLAVVAAMGAAALPARRAARMDVLDSLRG